MNNILKAAILMVEPISDKCKHSTCYLFPMLAKQNIICPKSNIQYHAGSECIK